MRLHPKSIAPSGRKSTRIRYCSMMTCTSEHLGKLLRSLQGNGALRKRGHLQDKERPTVTSRGRAISR
ncbi:hypothetical protein FHX49_001106 [Microbacterium endophyticum]|uniref:Uncharacterized protein n=1 Tax=Microbacterium endophyticum TaxID=1526412 RepID=A0A7W4V2C8_9MICO|nr:hypothetical protein [Microbacterium endophyticum]NIK35441.1 hypothetical protein [Microbacterium endophyticum]